MKKQLKLLTMLAIIVGLGHPAMADASELHVIAGEGCGADGQGNLGEMRMNADGTDILTCLYRNPDTSTTPCATNMNTIEAPCIWKGTKRLTCKTVAHGTMDSHLINDADAYTSFCGNEDMANPPKSGCQEDPSNVTGQAICNATYEGSTCVAVVDVTSNGNLALTCVGHQESTKKGTVQDDVVTCCY